MKISVVIPTRNRQALLRQSLESLARQTMPKTDFEVIVVDDESTDDTATMVAEFTNRLNLRYFYITHSGAVGRPRNVGLAAAQGEVIAFIDCGMYTLTGYLAAHWAFHNQHGPKAVGLGLCPGLGREDSEWLPAELTDEQLEQASLSWDTTVGIRDSRKDFNWEEIETPWVWLWTGNVSVRRAFIAEAGGFDENLKDWGFEDCEFGFRLHQAGGQFRQVENGWTVHLPHPRQALHTRMNSQYLNWQRSYSKHPFLTMEAYGTGGLVSFLYLHSLADLREVSGWYRQDFNPARLQATLATLTGSAGRTLVLGVAPQWQDWPELAGCELTIPELAQARPTFAPTNGSWPILGLLLPFADRSFDRIIVTPFWQLLRQRTHPDNHGYIEMLVHETRRVAGETIFLYEPEFITTTEYLRGRLKLYNPRATVINIAETVCLV